jgi:hypothetical protein
VVQDDQQHSYYYCGYQRVECNNAPISCAADDIPSANVYCHDGAHQCDNKRVMCDGSQLSCQTRFYCNDTNSLLYCGEHKVMCHSEPMSCLPSGSKQSAAKIVCIDPPKPHATYRPRVLCNDPLDQCQSLQVQCVKALSSGGLHYDSTTLACPIDGAQWTWNGTHANCGQFGDDRSKYKVAECADGSLVASCVFDQVSSSAWPQCSNPLPTCSNAYWDEQYPNIDQLAACASNITYDATNVYCNQTRMFCTRDLQLDVETVRCLRWPAACLSVSNTQLLTLRTQRQII